jgi:beta-mannosidase
MKKNIDLNGEWTLRREGESDTIPATVPGCVHADLLSANLIPDPFVGDNEDHLRWICHANWIYRREFETDHDLLDCDRVLLRCEGLDTIAAIRVNEAFVGRTDNMYRTWEFDVRSLLRRGTNAIEIHFSSPMDYIRDRQTVRRLDYPTAPRQIPNFSHIRKAAYSFGWDWGPCLPTCGIWRPVSLIGFRTARLQDVMISQEHSPEGNVKLDVRIRTEAASSPSPRLFVQTTLTFADAILQEQRRRVSGNRARIALDVPNPQRWWPNGMGAQNLYAITVELIDEDGTTLERQTRRIGLRTLRLIRQQDDDGETFTFQVNGIDFFAKGTNWIPADALATRMTTERYRHLLASAADANMNMVRVWGGGFYEADEFYDFCDEMGLCVWQDFMFACAPYPIEDKEFMDNVRIEIEQNVRRLRHHPCLALWCGNNEIEYCGFVALKADAGHMSLKRYQHVFEKTIPNLLARLDPGRGYWPGSPYKKIGDVYDPDVAIDNPDRGDAHVWSIWHLKKPFEFYRTSRHRFISEFGFQSFPEPTTVAAFTRPADRNVSSYVMEHHQRNGSGNAVILQYMLDWFRMPKDFHSTLWVSQILQALAMKIACEHWHRSMSRCMGTLIWQLNDAWPGASWSSIDYFGQWKALQYECRRFYAPLMVSAIEDLASGTVQAHVTSDLAESTECHLEWRLSDLQGGILATEKKSIQAPARHSRLAIELNIREHLEKTGARNLLLWLELTADGQQPSSNLVLFARPKHLELEDPGIQHRVEAIGSNAFSVTITAQKPALWVQIEIPREPIQCSDNFFHLEKGKTVQVRIKLPGTAERNREWVSENLKVSSLFDTYEYVP